MRQEHAVHLLEILSIARVTQAVVESMSSGCEVFISLEFVTC